MMDRYLLAPAHRCPLSGPKTFVSWGAMQGPAENMYGRVCFTAAAHCAKR